MGVTIDGVTYDMAHKTYCKKELARQYMEEVKKIRATEKSLTDNYNKAIEEFSSILKDSRADFRLNKSNNYPSL